MSNTFKFVGQIKKIEDKGDKKSLDTLFYPSGWMISKAKFRVVCGDQNQFVEVSCGKWKDDSKNTVFTYFNEEDEDGKKKLSLRKVDWDDRFNQQYLDECPNFKRFSVDLSSDNVRRSLKDAGKEDELYALNGLKYEYISKYDFTEKVKELLTQGAFGDKKYVVSGDINYSYSTNKNGEAYWYRSFEPTSIYLAGEDDAEGASGRLDVYYTPGDCIDEETDNGDTPITCYVRTYDRNDKKNYYVETVLKVRHGDERKDGFTKLFSIDKDCEVNTIGLDVVFYDGSQKVDITMDDLTEDQKSLIAWGLKTFEQIKKEMGGTAYGDRVSEIYIRDIARGYSNGPRGTEETMANFFATPSGDKKKGAATQEAKKNIDLFADDEI